MESTRRLSLVRAFLDEVDAAMSAVPRMVPPAPVDGWDGELCDVGGLHRAYMRLDEEVQGLAAPAYELCLDILAGQNHLAEWAQVVRRKLFVDLVVTGKFAIADLPVDEAIQDGEVTLIVSSVEKSAGELALHVHLVNSSTRPERADISLGADDSDPPAGPTMIPAKSTEHRVLRVRRKRGQKGPVMVKFRDTMPVQVMP